MDKRPDLDLPALLDSWTVELKAARKSKNTIKAYTAAVRLFLRWCEATDRPPVITRPAVLAWIAARVEAGYEGATVISNQQGLRTFTAWLTDEEEIETDPLAGLKLPQLDSKVVHPLTADQVKAMLAACDGKTFRDRRDEAALRMFAETGARASEVVNLLVEDVDLKAGVVTITRGKGGVGRRVPIGPQTCRALDRYLRARRSHKLAEQGRLWLGDRNMGMTYDGLRRSLMGRAETAGVEDFHLHRLRHTLADRWLDSGGSEGGLMALAGWTDPAMLRRYTQARAQARAADEARRLNLGEL